MNTRSFEWRDLPVLHSYRNSSVFLHNASVLTRGSLQITRALISSVTSRTGIFTAVCTGNEKKADDPALIGQISYSSGSQTAHLTFMAPGEELNSPNIQYLIEHLIKHTGELGSLRILADVDEDELAFIGLRRSGFSVYSRQKIWKIDNMAYDQELENPWLPVADSELSEICNLYNSLVPGMVQQVEPFFPERLNGLVLRNAQGLQAYIDLTYGLRGIWIQPFFHPDIENVGERLRQMLSNLPNLLSLPMYVCLRSYQSWLEPALKEFGADVCLNQVAMVKNIAVPLKAHRTIAMTSLNGRQPEITAPIVGMKCRKAEVRDCEAS